jgi:hypothetical protein
MSKSVPAIRHVSARGLVVSIGRPVKTAFTTIDAGPGLGLEWNESAVSKFLV